jgi:hypothetical protein
VVAMSVGAKGFLVGLRRRLARYLLFLVALVRFRPIFQFVQRTWGKRKLSCGLLDAY